MVDVTFGLEQTWFILACVGVVACLVGTTLGAVLACRRRGAQKNGGYQRKRDTEEGASDLLKSGDKDGQVNDGLGLTSLTPVATPGLDRKETAKKPEVTPAVDESAGAPRKDTVFINPDEAKKTAQEVAEPAEKTEEELEAERQAKKERLAAMRKARQEKKAREEELLIDALAWLDSLPDEV